jgi:hypothetical protein
MSAGAKDRQPAGALRDLLLAPVPTSEEQALESLSEAYELFKKLDDSTEGIELAGLWAERASEWVTTKLRPLRRCMWGVLNQCLRWKPAASCDILLRSLVRRPMEMIMGRHSAAVRLALELHDAHPQAFARGLASVIVSCGSSKTPPLSPIPPPQYAHGLGFPSSPTSTRSSLVPLPASELESSLLLLSHILSPLPDEYPPSLALMLIDAVIRAVAWKPKGRVSTDVSFVLGLQCMLELVPCGGSGLRDYVGGMLHFLRLALKACHGSASKSLVAEGVQPAPSQPPFPDIFALECSPNDERETLGPGFDGLGVSSGAYRLRWPGLPLGAGCRKAETVIPSGSRIARLEASVGGANSMLLGLRLWASDLEGRLEPLDWIGMSAAALEMKEMYPALVQTAQLQLSMGEYLVGVEACAGSGGRLVALRLITTHRQGPWLGGEDRGDHSLLLRGQPGQGMGSIHRWDEVVGISAVIYEDGTLGDLGVVLCPALHNPVITSEVLTQPASTLQRLTMRAVQVCYALFPRQLLNLLSESAMAASAAAPALHNFILHPELCGLSPTGAWESMDPEDLLLYVQAMAARGRSGKEIGWLHLSLSRPRRERPLQTALSIRRWRANSTSSASSSSRGRSSRDSSLESDSSEDHKGQLEEKSGSKFGLTPAAPSVPAPLFPEHRDTSWQALQAAGSIESANGVNTSVISSLQRTLLLLSSELMTERFRCQRLEDQLKLQGLRAAQAGTSAMAAQPGSRFAAGDSESSGDRVSFAPSTYDTSALPYSVEAADAVLEERNRGLSQLKAASSRHREAMMEAEAEKRKWLRAIQKQLSTESTLRHALSEDNAELRDNLRMKEGQLAELERRLMLLTTEAVEARGRRGQVERLQTQLQEAEAALARRAMEVESLRAAMPQAVAVVAAQHVAQSQSLIYERLRSSRSKTYTERMEPSSPQPHERIHMLKAELKEVRANLACTQKSAACAAAAADQQLQSLQYRYDALKIKLSAMEQHLLQQKVHGDGSTENDPHTSVMSL